jgi:hypothetical protein
LYRAIFAELQAPVPQLPAPPKFRRSWWDWLCTWGPRLLVGALILWVLSLGACRPDPHVRIVEQQRADVAQVEGELRDLRTLRATLGEGDVTRWDMENLDYRIDAAEQKLAAERAELAEAEQQLEEDT